MVSKIALGGIIFLVIIISGGLYLGNKVGLIDLEGRTLENTANGCDQYRNKCGFFRIVVSEGSIEKQRFDGSFYQTATYHVKPTGSGCLITEFPDVCVRELDFPVDEYKIKQYDIERTLVTVFERETIKRSDSASLEDEKAECRLIKPTSQCQSFEDIYCSELGCAVP